MELPKEVDSFLETVYKEKITVSHVEYGAFDNNWFHEQLHFYSKVRAPPYVQRFHLKNSKEEYIGFIHLRPVSASSIISEAYLAPPEYISEKNGHYIKCRGTYADYAPHQVNCVPYIQPDVTFSVCAQSAMWISLKILSNMTGGYIESYSLPDIQKIAKGHVFSDATGLELSVMGRILRMCHINAMIFSSEHDKKLTYDQLFKTVYAYVESGFPVILAVDTTHLPWWKDVRFHDNHALVVIGHSMSKGDISGLIVHDESRYPYQIIDKKTLKKAWARNTRTGLVCTSGKCKISAGRSDVRQFVVPLPFGVNLNYLTAYEMYKALVNHYVLRFNILNRKQLTEARPTLMPFGVMLQKYGNTTIGPINKAIIEQGMPPTEIQSGWCWCFLAYSSRENRMKDEPAALFVFDAVNKKILLVAGEGKVHTPDGKTYASDA